MAGAKSNANVWVGNLINPRSNSPHIAVNSRKLCFSQASARTWLSQGGCQLIHAAAHLKEVDQYMTFSYLRTAQNF
jgi:hypothetical protein